MTAQIPLDLHLAPDYSAASFLHSQSSAAARDALSHTNKWANNALALTGAKGSGKTHLGHIWASGVDALCLNGADDLAPDGSWRGRNIWIDDAAQAAEFTLFTVINLAITGEIKALLLTARAAPREWPVQLPDLQSRLRNIQTAKIEEADDELLIAIMGKMFKDKGLKVKDDLISFLLTNTERSVGALRVLISDLDREAAARKTGMTRSFASKYLQGKLL